MLAARTPVPSVATLQHLGQHQLPKIGATHQCHSLLLIMQVKMQRLSTKMSNLIQQGPPKRHNAAAWQRIGSSVEQPISGLFQEESAWARDFDLFRPGPDSPMLSAAAGMVQGSGAQPSPVEDRMNHLTSMVQEQ